uniref:Uncharacterized protein n=1 Tax=Avena sativa TaxID=4498 RepID=A0ACD5Y9F0_AVESA
MHRRFLNLVMHDNVHSTGALFRMDLKHLFYESAAIAEQAAQANAKNKLSALSMIQSCNGFRKQPLLNFKPSNFFTLLRESSILMADCSGRTQLIDSDFKSFLPMSRMKNGKGPNCVCFSIPSHDPFDSLDSQYLFVLNLVPGSSTKSSFEVLNYVRSDLSQPLVSSDSDMNWFWRALPLPPFVDDPVYSTSTKMCSSMVLGRSTICVSSMEEGVGTYTFDTDSHEWSQAGNWVLPFCGNAEYVPELKRWFALSASSPHTHSMCSLDLPAMGIELPPEVQCTWDYLYLPEQSPYKRHLLNMGSGKFCIVSFFKTLESVGLDKMIEDESVVFTGVEVCRCNSGEDAVRMINHMSKRYSCGTYRIHCVL